MIQLRTMLSVADNSGAKKLQVILVLGGHKRKWGQIGDVVVASVKEAEPRKAVAKGDKVRAVIVRQRRAFKRENGAYVRFDDNAVVILEKEKEPKGGRIFGPIPKEIKDLGYDKIASLAQEIV